MAKNESKILIFGGTGYIGRYMVMASLKLGHPTYVFSRPYSNKTELLAKFQSMGAIIVKVGKLNIYTLLVVLSTVVFLKNYYKKLWMCSVFCCFCRRNFKNTRSLFRCLEKLMW